MTSICSLQHLSSWVLVDAGYLHPSCATTTLERCSGRTGKRLRLLADARVVGGYCMTGTGMLFLVWRSVGGDM
jgi:hypothetical protein